MPQILEGEAQQRGVGTTKKLTKLEVDDTSYTVGLSLRSNELFRGRKRASLLQHAGYVITG